MTSTLVAPGSHTFTPEERSRGGIAGAEARKAALHAKVGYQQFLAELADGLDQAQIGQATLAASWVLTCRLLDDTEWSPLDLVRLAQAAETMFKMHRLATGQSTANTLTGTVDTVELTRRLADAQARAAALTAGQVAPQPDQEADTPS